MTRNQIAFYEAKERARSNRATEQLTSDRDKETARSNRASESIRWDQNRETAKHNRADEGIRRDTNAINHMSNVWKYQTESERNRINSASNELRGDELLLKERELVEAKIPESKAHVQRDTQYTSNLVNQGQLQNKELEYYDDRAKKELFGKDNSNTAGFIRNVKDIWDVLSPFVNGIFE